MLSNVMMLICWHKENLMVKKCFPWIFWYISRHVAVLTGSVTMATYRIGEEFDVE